MKFFLDGEASCCGCWACVNICPRGAVAMKPDELGFLYPVIDENKCVNCGLCRRVCPGLNMTKPVLPTGVYAAVNRDRDVLAASSSGGVFYELAKYVLTRNGVVFGAAWDDDFAVSHKQVEKMEDLPSLMGSKYVQSAIGFSFRRTEEYLKDKRPVLFSGTPCQIAGLKHYLGKDYPGLLAVNVICHSVPAPKVWKVFVKNAFRGNTVKHISMRHKNKCSCANLAFFDDLPRIGTNLEPLRIKPLYDTSFGVGFGRELFARTSCFKCPAKNFTSGSDIIIGDFWKIEEVFPDLNVNNGVSAVLIQTEKGKEIWNEISREFVLYPSDLQAVMKGNPRLSKSCGQAASVRDEFKKDFEEKPTVSTLIKHTRPSIKELLCRILRGTALLDCLRKIKIILIKR